MWDSKKFPIFLCTRRQILVFMRLLGELEMCLLNDKINSEEVFYFTEFCLCIHKNNNWEVKFQFRDLFVDFLHKQALYPYAVTKPNFSDFG